MMAVDINRKYYSNNKISWLLIFKIKPIKEFAKCSWSVQFIICIGIQHGINIYPSQFLLTFMLMWCHVILTSGDSYLFIAIRVHNYSCGLSRLRVKYISQLLSNVYPLTPSGRINDFIVTFLLWPLSLLVEGSSPAKYLSSNLGSSANFWSRSIHYRDNTINKHDTNVTKMSSWGFEIAH